MEDTREYFEHHKQYYINNLPCSCVNCGSTDNLYLHHIVPLSLGGTNKLSNIVPLCGNCHSKIHGTKAINIRELAKKGKEKAKKKAKEEGGVFKEGRPRVDPARIEEALRMLTVNGGDKSYKQVAHLTGISVPTLVRRQQEYRNKQQ